MVAIFAAIARQSTPWSLFSSIMARSRSRSASAVHGEGMMAMMIVNLVLVIVRK